MCFVYLIVEKNSQKRYIGRTEDLDTRHFSAKRMLLCVNTGSNMTVEAEDFCTKGLLILLLVKNRCWGLRALIRSYKGIASKTVWKVRP